MFSAVAHYSLTDGQIDVWKTISPDDFAKNMN